MKKLLAFILVYFGVAGSISAGNGWSSAAAGPSPEQIYFQSLVDEYGEDIANRYAAQFRPLSKEAEDLRRDLFSRILKQKLWTPELWQSSGEWAGVATLDAPDKYHRSSVAYAAEVGNLNALIGLLAAGANPNGFCTNTIECLRANIAGGSSLGLSLYVAPDELVNNNLECWATPLRIASERGDDQMVQWLLSQEDIIVDGCKKYNASTTPLHVALTGKVADLLLNAGASATAEDKNGLRPLHRAVLDRRSEVVTVLTHTYAASDLHIELTEDIISNYRLALVVGTRMTALQLAQYLSYDEIAETIETSPCYTDCDIDVESERVAQIADFLSSIGGEE